jgi:hypothetical protein
MLNRIPEPILTASARGAYLLLFSLGGLLLFVLSLALSGHLHPAAPAAYAHVLLHDYPFLVGWGVFVLVSSAEYGVARGSPMPTLEGALFMAAMGFMPHILAPLAAHPGAEVTAGALALAWLVSMFVRFKGDMLVLPLFIATGVFTAAVAMPFWLVPPVRRAAAEWLGLRCGGFVESCVVLSVGTLGLPLIILGAIVAALVPSTRKPLLRIFEGITDWMELPLPTTPAACK